MKLIERQGDEWRCGRVRMWRFGDDNGFRFQTDDPQINRKLRQRNDFWLVAWGVNCPLWIYMTYKHDLKSAKRTLQRLGNTKPKGRVASTEKVPPGEPISGKKGTIVAPKTMSEMDSVEVN